MARVVAGALLGAVAGLLVLGRWGLAAGLVVGSGCGWWLARQPTAAQVTWQRQFEADLPLTIDLLAAALRAGATPQAAARQVAEALDGPVSACLFQVERSLLLGAAPADAWTLLGRWDGAQRVVRAVQRSGDSGAALARALIRVAQDIRADSQSALEGKAQAAGVLIVLPLGLCFLPAFVLMGLVPVIVAVVGDVITLTP